ncbi:hypothetical protein VNO78_12693 [Psophocarpus tetragonolobus]|uniref:Dirigent protein n=1 Tax=Psophocarpus tetragonolobus TaxID=3891 RepID=A0AAN9SW05_PSOTE
MASFLSLLFVFYVIVIMSSSLPTTSENFAKESPVFASAKPLEKLTQLHFYFHDSIRGKNPTSMYIVEPPKGSINRFGSLIMMDDPLTEGPGPNSKLVGRSQGMYAVASQHEYGLSIMASFLFTEGIYNGSTLSIVGMNHALQNVREISVVGGSGVFRYARGSALLKTYFYNGISGAAIVECNVSAIHV